MAGERLTVEDVADQIIELVRATPIGGTRGDSAALVMHGAYLRAFRRFERIRQIAATGAGEEAVILARSLLSLVARAVWVDLPDDKAERRARWERYAKHHLSERIKTLEGMKALGFNVDEEVIDFDREQLKTVEHAKGLPSDRQLLEQLNLHAWYHRLYRLSSDYAHFSLGVAIDELRGAEEVHFDRDDSDLADEALRLSVLIFGLFLHLSDKTVAHGLRGRVLPIVKSSPAFSGEATGTWPMLAGLAAGERRARDGHEAAPVEGEREQRHREGGDGADRRGEHAGGDRMRAGLAGHGQSADARGLIEPGVPRQDGCDAGDRGHQEIEHRRAERRFDANGVEDAEDGRPLHEPGGDGHRSRPQEHVPRSGGPLEEGVERTGQPVPDPPVHRAGGGERSRCEQRQADEPGPTPGRDRQEERGAGADEGEPDAVEQMLAEQASAGRRQARPARPGRHAEDAQLRHLAQTAREDGVQERPHGAGRVDRPELDRLA